MPKLNLQKVGKSLNIPNYPTKWAKKVTAEDERQTRSTTSDHIPESAKSTKTQAGFNNDVKKLWNKAPQDIKDCSSLQMAKKP